MSIVQLQVRQVVERLSKKNIQVEFTSKALKHLGKRGFDPIYGARPLRRLIQNEVLNPIAKDMISGKLKAGSHLNVDADDLHLLFKY